MKNANDTNTADADGANIIFETPRQSDSKILPIEEVVTEVNPQTLILRIIEGYSTPADTIGALNALLTF